LKTLISVLVVNLNNLEFTRNCLNDLIQQDIPFNLRLVDQNSTEQGTQEFFHEFFKRHTEYGEFYGKISFLETINTGYNRPLNHLWNDFVHESSTPFCCILNNDVRVVPNFLSSAIKVLQKETNVGFVNHTTNSEKFSTWSNILDYDVIETPYRQGWDFIFRKECYNKIPEELTFFYGDDYIYSKLYSSGKKGAYVLNSPMLHFERSTTEEKNGVRDLSLDREFYLSLEMEFSELSFHSEYSKWKPEFQNFLSKN
jgi:GT2 family glycosyltransferase